jgi:hypothetical protein
MGKALTYATNQREALSRFLDDAKLPLDNNHTYAARGITDAMPRPGLCRVEARGCREFGGIPGPGLRPSRHSHQRFFRNASKLSDGRNRAGLVPDRLA